MWLQTSLSSSSKLSFKQHLCQGNRKAACFTPQRPHICHPALWSQEIITFPGAPGGRWSSKDPPSYQDSNNTQRTPGPCLSCQGYQRPGDEANAWELVQVCSANCRVTVDIIRGGSWSPRSCRRGSCLRVVIIKAEENSSSGKEPN